MVEADSNILEYKSETLNEIGLTEWTYGDGTGDWDVEAGGIGGRDEEGIRGARVGRTPFVQRNPAGRGARSIIPPAFNCLKVRGTSTPKFLSPNGRPAENNR